MSQRKTCLLLAAILAVAGIGAFAAEPEHEQHHPGAAPPAAASTPAPPIPGMSMGSMPGASGSMPMTGMMQMMMGQHGMAGHVEGRIAFLRAELKISDAQQPLWNAVADTMRANEKRLADMPSGMAMSGSKATLPERLAMLEKAMAAQLGALDRLRATVGPLYAAFTADQKKTADELMIGPMGMMGLRMM